MSDVTVQKVNGPARDASPIFEQIRKRLEEVRGRAFELFEKRGREFGHAVEDWLEAEKDVMGWPAAEMKENDGVYSIEVALPGIETKDVQVTATPVEIVLQAASQREKKTEEGTVLWTEFRSNEVCRRFEARDTIDPDKVTAKLEKGILRITAPKMAAAKEKTVKVAAA
jgi:HSP20 family protein